MATTRRAPLLRYIRHLAAAGGLDQLADRELLQRFAVEHDEEAFAVLVRRHGRMVLHVGERVLHNRHDAEDVFQATFLVLSRKAGSLRWRESVGNWLYQVAYRNARKARASAARRGLKEARAAGASAVEVRDDLSWREVELLLDEELHRLPVKYRVPLVFCYLEGVTRDEAAQQLGWSLSTLKRRLERGRELLRLRLVRRGLTLSAALFTPMLMQNTAQATLAPNLVQATVRTVLQVAAGRPMTGLVSAQVAALVEGGFKTMLLTKVKVLTVLLFAVGVVAGAGALTRQVLAAKQTEKPAAGAPQLLKPPAHEREEKNGTLTIGGRVLDAEGQPVAGAKLVFLYPSTEKVLEKIWATSAGDGRFHFSITKNIEDAAGWAKPWDHTHVVAVAEGFGFAWARVRPDAPGELTLHLVKDDVPIQGRIVDLQGRPVAGATVRIDKQMFVPTKGELTAWLKTLSADNPNPNYMDPREFTELFGSALTMLFAPVATGADGRFTLKGIGRERVASLQVQGPTMATQTFRAMTRPLDMIRLTRPHGPITFYGACFDLVSLPTRPIVGVVRDKETGKPLAGVTVRSHRSAVTYDLNGLCRTTTDQEGRYRLVGLPKGEGNEIIAEAYGRVPRAEDLPYLAAIRKVSDSPGLEPITVDIALKRGIWLTGRVFDKTTNKPLQGGFDYFCFTDNPAAAELPRLGHVPMDWTLKDGTFRTVAVPGQGVIGMRAYGDRYPMGVGAENIKGLRSEVGFSTVPYYCTPSNYQMLLEVNPKPGDESITCDVGLDPGHTLTGVVLGPAGNRLAAVRVFGLQAMASWGRDLLSSAEFTVQGLRVDERRLLQFVHEDKQLAGSVVIGGDEKGPVTVKLQPSGTLIGRLVNVDGMPMTDIEIISVGGRQRDDLAAGSFPRRIRPGKDGKFRIEGLVPGLKYNFHVAKRSYSFALSGKTKDLTIESAQTKDLGDIQVTPME